MDCKEWKPEWIAYLYDEMSSSEREAVEEHLADCSVCRAELDRLGSTQQTLRASSPAVPSAPRVVMLAPSRFGKPAWSFAAGALAAVLALVGFFAGSRYASVAPTVVSRAELQSALEAQQARFEGLLSEDQAVLPASITLEEFEQGLARMERRCAADRTRDLEFILGEISATEQRAGNWIDQTRSETRNALRYVALQNDPRFSER